MNWIDAIAHSARANVGFVVVTVLETEGSAPRDVAAKMVVLAERTEDSIGGGNLEFEATQVARDLLHARDDPIIQQRVFSLGADLTQCCGGKVTLLFECFPPWDFSVVLFGAGHVGTALTTILAQLPCRVQWVDSRDIFPASLASNIKPVAMENAFAAVEDCAPAAYYLIMTHSHELDLELCEAILTRGDSRYCGLIGSRSKGAKFRSQLKKKGFTAAELARLTCPIGMESIPGKTPMEVAVSVAGELLALRHQERVASSE